MDRDSSATPGGKQVVPAGVLGRQANTSTMRLRKRNRKKHRAFIGRAVMAQHAEENDPSGRLYSPSEEG